MAKLFDTHAHYTDERLFGNEELLAEIFAGDVGNIITVAVDVADSEKCYVIRNGVPQMSRITGTGCQLSGIATAYAVANKDDITNAVASAVCVMGLAGEMGFANLKENEGNSTLRNRIIDAICNMDEESLTKGAKYELR